MRTIIVVLLFCSLANTIFSQETNQALLGEILGEVTEVSGLVMTENGHLLAIGDSGNLPKIYELNYSGEVINSLVLDGAENVDWEELQLDEEGTLYIGDVGNNLGQRLFLNIYIIPNIETKLNQDTISSFSTLSFNYDDQESFTADSSTPFDAEGFIVIEDEIHLFSKNHGDQSFTKRYILTSSPGYQTAFLMDSVKLDFWVTGATYNYHLDKLTLCSDERLYNFENYSKSTFTKASCLINIDASQIEAVCTSPSGAFYLAEDVESESPSLLFRLIYDCYENVVLDLWPNPTADILTISSNAIFQKVEIHNSSGELVRKIEFELGALRTQLSLIELKSGIYTISMYAESNFSVRRMIIL